MLIQKKVKKLFIPFITAILFILGCLLIIQTASAFFNKEKFSDDPVEVRILPTRSKGAFGKKHPIKYKATFKNNLDRDQDGSLVYVIKNNEDEVVFSGNFVVKVIAKKTLESSFDIPFTDNGAYTIDFDLTLTEFKSHLTSTFFYKNENSTKSNPGKTVNPYDHNNTVENFNIIGASEDIPKDEAEAEVLEEDSEEEGEIVSLVTPIKKDGIFWDANNIGYEVQLTNTYKTKQTGTFTIILKNDKGEDLETRVAEIKISKKGTRRFKIKIPPVSKPGIYGVSMAINLSSYDDTLKHAFGYQISKISTPYHRPPDFEAYWKKAKEDLDAVDPKYNIILDDKLSTRFHKTYKVEMISLDEVKIFGWLTIPRLPKKFPVIVGFQGYRVELDPLYYEGSIGFNLNTRGIEKNWKPFNPEDEQPLLINITDRDKYMYRGMYMDCVRAIEFLYSHEDLGFDLSRVLVFGGSQGAALSLVTAALTTNKINAIIVDNPIFCDFHESYKLISNKLYDNFPTKQLIEFTQKNPGVTMEQLLDNMSYFEVQNFMPMINCSVLYAVSLLDPLAPAATVIAAYNKLNPNTIEKSEMYVAPNLGHEITMNHRYYQMTWMSEQLVRKRQNIGK